MSWDQNLINYIASPQSRIDFREPFRLDLSSGCTSCEGVARPNRLSFRLVTARRRQGVSAILGSWTPHTTQGLEVGPFGGIVSAQLALTTEPAGRWTFNPAGEFSKFALKQSCLCRQEAVRKLQRFGQMASTGGDSKLQQHLLEKANYEPLQTPSKLSTTATAAEACRQIWAFLTHVDVRYPVLHEKRDFW